MTEVVWITGLLLALASGLWLVIGSKRGAAGVKARERDQLNAEAFKRQRDVLAQRLSAGELNREQHGEALLQLEQTFAAEMQGAAQGQKPLRNASWSMGQKLALSVLPLLLAAAAFQLSNGAQHFAVAQAADEAQPSVEELVEALRVRLQQQPDDLRGWIMLGRTYGAMGRHGEAAQAYAQANTLTEAGNPDLLVAQAEALAMANAQHLDGEVVALINQALALDGEHLRALWYALLAANQREDEAGQREYLKRLGAHPGLPDDMAAWLSAEFGAQFQRTASVVTESGLSFPIRVTVAPEFVDQVPADASLFVFVRAADGPPMPLAVSRLSLPQQWPVKITLDDSMSMLEGMKLSSFDAWTVVARITASGQVKAQSGDWQASVDLHAPPQDTIELTIDQQLP